MAKVILPESNTSSIFSCKHEDLFYIFTTAVKDKFYRYGTLKKGENFYCGSKYIEQSEKWSTIYVTNMATDKH